MEDQSCVVIRTLSRAVDPASEFMESTHGWFPGIVLTEICLNGSIPTTIFQMSD